MTASRTRTRRVAAIVLAVTALAALLPAGASAAAPARLSPEPEHAYAVIRGVGGPEGIVMLEERSAGVFIGIGMTGVRSRVVSLHGASAPCGDVGFSTVRLGTFHPVDGRFAAGYVSAAADAVDAIRSVRLMAGNALLACRTLVQGDRDGVSCDIDPGQPDCPRREYVAPRMGEWFRKLLRLGLIYIVGERLGPGPASTGEVIATFLVIRKGAYGITLGDASCADGGGKKLAQVSLPGVNYGLHVGTVLGERTVGTFASARVFAPGGAAPVGCVDLALHQVAWNYPS